MIKDNLELITTILAATSGLMVLGFIVMTIILIKMSIRYKKFTKLSGETNIEEVLISNQSKIKSLINDQTKTEMEIVKIKENLMKTFEKVAMIKYDAFDGMGGQLSAVIVLMNKNQDGFLLNSIHTRNGSHMYTKQIIKGKTEQALSKEEQEAIKIAINN